MAVQIITHDFGDQFYDLLDKTKQRISIISPFIGLQTATKLSEWIECNNNVNCIIITRFYREDFVQNASNIEGLHRLCKAGANLYALKDLHSKLYLFDSDSTLLGSANFTRGGFYSNHEFGILLDKEPEITDQCQVYFNELLKTIKGTGDWKITEKQIEEEKEQVNKIVHNRKNKNVEYKNNTKWGAEVSLESNDDFMEQVLLKDKQDVETGIWIKFEGTSEDRIPNDQVYLERKRKTNQYLGKTFFPRKPKGIKKGHIIFVAVISKDSQGLPVPIIVGYAESKGFDEKNIINTNDPKLSSWADRFPYYLEYVNGKFLDAPIKHGISLQDLYRDMGANTFPSTKGNPNIKAEQIRIRHHQKSHIQITEEARDYLLKKLGEIFNKYGYKEV